MTKGGTVFGGGIHNATTKPILASAKKRLSEKAGQIAKEKGLGPSLNTLTNESYRERVKGGYSEFKEGMRKTDFKEKAVLGADSLFNRKENSLAKVARSKDAHDFKDYLSAKSQSSRIGDKEVNPKSIRMPLSGHKEEARSFQAQSQMHRDQSRGLPEAQNFLNDRSLKGLKPQSTTPSFRYSYMRPKVAVNPFNRLSAKTDRNTTSNSFTTKIRGGINGRTSNV